MVGAFVTSVLYGVSRYCAHVAALELMLLLTQVAVMQVSTLTQWIYPPFHKYPL